MSRFALLLTPFLAFTAGTTAAQDITPDSERGERLFRQCMACHTLDEGGPNRQGPNLWGFYGEPIASNESFHSRYSPAFLESDIIWTTETLDAFLAEPRQYIPGNRMVFAPLRREQDRADVIAYLRQATGADEVATDGEGEEADEAEAAEETPESTE